MIKEICNNTKSSARLVVAQMHTIYGTLPLYVKTDGCGGKHKMMKGINQNLLFFFLFFFQQRTMSTGRKDTLESVSNPLHYQI